MEVRQITNDDQLQCFYRMRYKVFVEGKKDVTKDRFPNGLLKDDEDDYAFHFGCYDGAVLLGGVSVVIKNTPKGLNKNFNEVESEPYNLVCEKESAQVKTLMVVDENAGNDIFFRGRVLESLFTAVREMTLAHHVKYIYMIAVEKPKSMYEKFGFTQIGDFQLFKGTFWACPMKLMVEDSATHIHELKNS